MTNKPSIFVYTTLFSATGGGQYAMTVLAQELHRRGYRLQFFTRPPFQADHRYVRMLSEINVPVTVFTRYAETWWGRLLVAVIATILMLPYLVLRRCSPTRAFHAATSIVRTWLVRREEANACRQLSRCLRAEQEQGRDVILHLWSPAALSPLLLKWANRASVPVIFQEMGEADEEYVRTWHLQPSIQELHRTSAVVALGSRDAKNIRDVYGYSGEITVIPATVADYRNVVISGSQRSGRTTIGIIGRLVAHKRHNELLLAIQAIRNTGRDVGLVIAGDGPMRQALEDETRQLGLSDVVKFTGEFERIEDVMSLFDIFAITSISESQCMPILESGAFGKPVIAADSGGMPDFVDDGVTGIIVPIGDHNALVAALIRLIDDSALCERMGQAGRRRYLERHTPDRIADLHDDLNLRLLADRPGVGLHVAYIVECYATFIVDEINMLRRLGVKVSLFNAFRPTPESDPKKEDFRRESHYFPSGYRGVFLANVSAFVRRPIGYLRALWLVSREGESLRMLLLAGFLARIVRSEQIDHFHGTFGTRTTTLAALLSFLTGRTYSFTTHAYDIYRPNPSLVWKTNGAAFMRTISDFNKQFIEQTYLGIEAKKILVGYLGISSEMFNSKIKCYNYIKEPISIIAVGSLIEQKGHIILIRACRILNDRGYDLTCLLIGDGEKRGLIIDEIQRQGLKNIIRLLGLLPHANIISYLLSADIFALPCMDLRGKGEHIDGIPVALMEAMAVGLPTIATRISGIPELIEDGVSGLLVPEKDEIALADAIARLIEDPDLRASLGHGARRRIEERFDLGRNVHLLANEFCRAIGIPFQEGCEVHTEERSRGLSPEPQRES